jgi:hypothetical protein
MKKRVHKLQLSRETVRRLEITPGSPIFGGITERETCGFTCKESCGEPTRCSLRCP